ncbi:MAG TPA: response regulator [Chloroflexota bacterium]
MGPEADRVVFVVDDDPAVRRLIATGLHHRFGVHAMPMAGAEEALTWALTVRPILILTDLMMPDLDGAELTRRVKSDPSTADIPVVVMSGGGSSARARALAAGADEFLAKPIRFADLGEVLGRWLIGLRGPSPAPPTRDEGTTA